MPKVVTPISASWHFLGKFTLETHMEPLLPYLGIGGRHFGMASAFAHPLEMCQILLILSIFMTLHLGNGGLTM